MSKDKEIDPFYITSAKEFVDMLHDAKILNPKLTREDTRTLDEYVAYMYQSINDSAKRTLELRETMKKYKGTK